MTKRRGRGEGTIEHRGGDRWRLRVYTGKVDGTPQQVSRTVHAANKTAALRQLRQFVTEIDSGKIVPGAGPRSTVEVVLNKWLDHLATTGKAQTTLETYRLLVDKHLIPALGHLELRSVGPYELDAYYLACSAKGTAPRTIRLRHFILSAAFTQAVKWGWIDKNPAAYATPPRVPRGIKFIPEVAQVRALLDGAGDDEDLKTAVALASLTGARRGELCGLRWSDVDWVAGTLLIERQRVPVKGGQRTAPLKHGERRTVHLGPLGMEVLRLYKATTGERARGFGIEPDWQGWLLSADCGRTPTRAQTLSEAITDLGKRVGVPVTTHAFRRFAATQMVGAGVDVRTAAGRLGHTPEMLLRVYAGFLPRLDQQAAVTLGGLVLGPAERKVAPQEETGND